MVEGTGQRIATAEEAKANSEGLAVRKRRFWPTQKRFMAIGTKEEQLKTHMTNFLALDNPRSSEYWSL